MSYGRTMKERAKGAIAAIPDPAQQADIRNYVNLLEQRVRQSSDEASRLRFPDTTGQ